MKRWIGGMALAVGLVFGAMSPATAAPLDEVLARLNFSIVGMGLTAAPDYQAMPKGIATQVATGFDSAQTMLVNPEDISSPRNFPVTNSPFCA